VARIVGVETFFAWDVAWCACAPRTGTRAEARWRPTMPTGPGRGVDIRPGWLARGEGARSVLVLD
jgi:hypothetical protein